MSAARRLRGGAGAVALLAALLAAGCGGGGTGGAVSWKGTPQVFAPRDLPRDRIVLGRVWNTSLREKTRLRRHWWLGGTLTRNRFTKWHWIAWET